MLKGLSVLAALALFALIRLLVKNKWAVKGAAILLPCAAAAVSAAWEPLCLIPVFGMEGWLDLPGRLRRQTPKEAEARIALIWEEAVVSGGPQVTALCAPFQLEGSDKRRGGNVLFNTAMALCGQEGDGLCEYAAAQGFEKHRLTARMPLMDRWQDGELTFVRHQDRDGLRTFVMGSAACIHDACKWVLDGRERLMSVEERQSILESEQAMRQSGLQVYAFAMAGEGSCTYLGMAATSLPVRKGAYEQIKRLERLGAQPVLMGQGSRESVWALASQTGIIRPGDRLVTRGELERMDDMRLEEEVREIAAYVDLDAADRKRIITAWEQWGETVLQLGPDGLDVWERALKTGRRLEKAAARLEKDGPLLTFAPAGVTLIGAMLDLWPICVVSLLMCLGLWAFQLLKK